MLCFADSSGATEVSEPVASPVTVTSSVSAGSFEASRPRARSEFRLPKLPWSQEHSNVATSRSDQLVTGSCFTNRQPFRS
jgi:hypothetical protein